MSRELDIKVAKTLGYEVKKAQFSRSKTDFEIYDKIEMPFGSLPHYSTDISAAWQLFEMMPEPALNYHPKSKGDRYDCVPNVSAYGFAWQSASTAPEAICRAFLAWKGVA